MGTDDGGPGTTTIVVMGVSGSGKSTVAAGARRAARLGVRRGRRLPPAGERREDAGRAPPRRRGPLAVAAHAWPPGSASTSGPGAPSSSPARRSSAATATCSATAIRRCWFAHVTADRELHPGPPRAPHRPLHAGLAARQPARHARAARRTTNPARASPAPGRPPSVVDDAPRRARRRARSPPERPGGTRHDPARRRPSTRTGSDSQLILAAVARHRRRRRADHLAEGAPVPGADPRLAAARGRRRAGASTDIITSFQTGVGATVGSVGRADRARRDDRRHARRVRRRRPRSSTRFVDRVSAAPAALGDGRGRGADRHPAVLRGRRRPARPDRAARGPAHAAAGAARSASRRWPACRCCTGWCRRTPGRWSPSTRWTPTSAGR